MKELLQKFSGKAPGFTITSLVTCQTHKLKRLLVICSSAIIFCHYHDVSSAALRLLDALVWRLTFNIRKTKLYLYFYKIFSGKFFKEQPWWMLKVSIDLILVRFVSKEALVNIMIHAPCVFKRFIENRFLLSSAITIFSQAALWNSYCKVLGGLLEQHLETVVDVLVTTPWEKPGNPGKESQKLTMSEKLTTSLPRKKYAAKHKLPKPSTWPLYCFLFQTFRIFDDLQRFICFKPLPHSPRVLERRWGINKHSRYVLHLSDCRFY